jgi:hypothetical protein
MDAMKIFFSVIVINIIEGVPPPKRVGGYNDNVLYDHKRELCEACREGRCITRRNYS